MGSFQKAIITIKTFQSNHGPPLRRKCVININFVAFRNVHFGYAVVRYCGNELRGIERDRQSIKYMRCFVVFMRVSNISFLVKMFGHFVYE